MIIQTSFAVSPIMIKKKRLQRGLTLKSSVIKRQTFKLNICTVYVNDVTLFFCRNNIYIYISIQKHIVNKPNICTVNEFSMMNMFHDF